MRVTKARSMDQNSSLPSTPFNCDGFRDFPDPTAFFYPLHYLPLTPPRSQASSSDHHGSSPLCPSPPTVPSTMAAYAQPSPVVGLPHDVDYLIRYIRPRAFGPESIHLSLSADVCSDLVERLDTLPRSDPLRYLRFYTSPP